MQLRVAGLDIPRGDCHSRVKRYVHPATAVTEGHDALVLRLPVRERSRLAPREVLHKFAMPSTADSGSRGIENVTPRRTSNA